MRALRSVAAKSLGVLMLLATAIGMLAVPKNPPLDSGVLNAPLRLMQRLREEDGSLSPVEIRLEKHTQPEQDAMRALHMLTEMYEPLKIRKWFRKRHSK